MRSCILLLILLAPSAGAGQDTLGDLVRLDTVPAKERIRTADAIVVGTVRTIDKVGYAQTIYQPGANNNGLEVQRLLVSVDVEAVLKGGSGLGVGRAVPFAWWAWVENAPVRQESTILRRGDRRVFLLTHEETGYRALQDLVLAGYGLLGAEPIGHPPDDWSLYDKISFYLLTPSEDVDTHRFAARLMYSNSIASELSKRPFAASLVKRLLAHEDDQVRLRACLTLALSHGGYGQDDCLGDLARDQEAAAELRATVARLLKERREADLRTKMDLARVDEWRELYRQRGHLKEFCRQISELAWHSDSGIRDRACAAYSDSPECGHCRSACN